MGGCTKADRSVNRGRVRGLDDGTVRSGERGRPRVGVGHREVARCVMMFTAGGREPQCLRVHGVRGELAMTDVAYGFVSVDQDFESLSCLQTSHPTAKLGPKRFGLFKVTDVLCPTSMTYCLDLPLN